MEILVKEGTDLASAKARCPVKLVGGYAENMAERVGFEPTLPCGKHAFQACAFSHSAISPLLGSLYKSITVSRSLSDAAAPPHDPAH